MFKYYTILLFKYNKFDDSPLTIRNGKQAHNFLKEKTSVVMTTEESYFFIVGPNNYDTMT